MQGAFPLLFILLFLSSAFFPRETMNGAYRRIADLNPISHLVEGFRDLTIEGLSWSAVGRTLLISGGLAVRRHGDRPAQPSQADRGTMSQTLDPIGRDGRVSAPRGPPRWPPPVPWRSGACATSAACHRRSFRRC